MILNRSRKLLIELLRDFKKNNNDEVRQIVAPIVKSFQNEVDSLAKRSKAAEKAFFDIYRSLADVPDPLPILEQSIERNQQLSSKIQDYEIETKQLRETMNDQAKEITELKSKDKKLQELQNLVAQYDKNIDSTMKEKLATEVEKIKAEFNDKMQLVEDQKEELTKKCKDAENVAKVTQRQLEQTQSDLFEATNKLAQKSDAKTDEVEMLMNDLESANQRAIIAERELESLREVIESNSEKMSSSSHQDNIANDQNIQELHKELEAKDLEKLHVSNELERVQKEFEQVEASKNSKILELEEINKDLASKLSKVEEAIENMSDYQSIKKDLSILRSLEFGDESEDRPLEVMILERSKSLQVENTSLRMDKEHLTSELTMTKEDLASKVNEGDRQAQLISELEDHVEKLQEHVNRGEAEGRSSTDILYDLDLGKTGRESPQSITSSFYEKNGDASSLLPIIQAQRERYKRRNEELEEQQSRHMQQMALLQSEVKDLQADNVKLYEKIRYLQGYQTSKKNDSVMIPVETRYKNQYEQKIDPFTSFSNQERQRK